MPKWLQYPGDRIFSASPPRVAGAQGRASSAASPGHRHGAGLEVAQFRTKPAPTEDAITAGRGLAYYYGTGLPT